MILFDLRCSNDHTFEAWFKDGKTFDRQAKGGHVPCPVCGDDKVQKALMAPRIAKGAAAPDLPTERPAPETAPPSAEHVQKFYAMMGELRKHVEANCDYVGPEFAEEARKIHYGETDKRNIYGEASPDEAKALHEEGVEFGAIPWAPRHDA